MSCLMYSQGKCRKQPVGMVSSGLLVRHVETTFAPCQFDGRVWVGSMAFAGRAQDLALRHEDCSMHEGSLVERGVAAVGPGVVAVDVLPDFEAQIATMRATPGAG